MNETFSESLLASIEGFTSDSRVFLRILVSVHKSLASPLKFNSFVSLLASLWLPIVRSQRFENRSQGMNIFNKIE